MRTPSSSSTAKDGNGEYDRVILRVLSYLF